MRKKGVVVVGVAFKKTARERPVREGLLRGFEL